MTLYFRFFPAKMYMQEIFPSLLQNNYVRL